MGCCKSKLMLSDIGKGCKAKIVCNGCDEVSKKRFLEMGLNNGTSVSVVRTAPLGDPVVIRVRNYLMILRKCECSKICVEKEK